MKLEDEEEIGKEYEKHLEETDKIADKILKEISERRKKKRKKPRPLEANKPITCRNCGTKFLAYKSHATYCTIKCKRTWCYWNSPGYRLKELAQRRRFYLAHREELLIKKREYYKKLRLRKSNQGA